MNSWTLKECSAIYGRADRSDLRSVVSRGWHRESEGSNSWPHDGQRTLAEAPPATLPGFNSLLELELGEVVPDG